MPALIHQHWPRMLVTLLPVIVALLHSIGVMHWGVLQRLDDVIYDTRLVAAMPQTMDERIVIVDIDDKSLAEVGRWPWGRNKVAKLIDTLFANDVAVVGFDIVFSESDQSSGLGQIKQLAETEFKDFPTFSERARKLESTLDYDRLLATALIQRPVVLGYFFDNSDDARQSGTLPKPVVEKSEMVRRPIIGPQWRGYGSNIDLLAQAAPLAGHFNPIVDTDGVVRAVPLLVPFQNQYYESLSLAVFRVLTGLPHVGIGFSSESNLSRDRQGLDHVVLTHEFKKLSIPVDEKVSTLVPYRGRGGKPGGSYRYVSASDVLMGKVSVETLKGKIILIGTTALGLLDMRVTPVGETYPGVEIHANLLTGLLDGSIRVKPDYAVGYDVAMLMLSGLILAVGLPLLSAVRAVALSLVVIGLLVAANFGFYFGAGWVLPVAASLVMAVTAFALNMSYGYFVESRSKRELAQLFGTYVPPELVDEMVRDPDNYSMKASNRELTVMFCDMRGFTKMSETMEPVQLQELLTGVFSELTSRIRANRGTIDKYMGDCVMAFWGAPVETEQHAHLAVKSAVEMVHAVQSINHEHRQRGLPEISIGIGLNTGTMCVGDMGSNIRRAYTVIGDSVNLGSRLEGLSKIYGVDIVVSESTKTQTVQYVWQELDRVRVKGKDQAVSIFCPVTTTDAVGKEIESEIKTWNLFLKAYRLQDWDHADVMLINLMRMNAKKYLYRLYAERVASMRLLPFDPTWDGATNFETK
jgi:adenylate cyclase